MTGQRVLSFALAAWLALPLPGKAGSITTPEIVAQTTAAAFSCMQWMPIGTCFWLRCSSSGCSVETSLKVGHYNPDLVVSSYNELGGNPWAEIRATLGLAQKTAATGLLGALLPVLIDSAGNRTEGTSERDHKNLIYRETDAIGHPLSSLTGIVAGTGLLCPSETTSFIFNVPQAAVPVDNRQQRHARGTAPPLGGFAFGAAPRPASPLRPFGRFAPFAPPLRVGLSRPVAAQKCLACGQ